MLEAEWMFDVDLFKIYIILNHFCYFHVLNYYLITIFMIIFFVREIYLINNKLGTFKLYVHCYFRRVSELVIKNNNEGRI